VQWNPVYTQGVWQLLLDWLPIQRFVVQDTSMQPTLQPGDRLLVARRALSKFGSDDLVVLREPDRHLTFAIKRIAALHANGDVIVAADNPNVSRDSRDYGGVPRKLIVGRAIYRYLPAHRRGPL
jgi:nickel-type superoxide dismutase maturation protease